MTMRTLAIVYLCIVAALSLVSLLAYGFDKRKAKRGDRRIPERTLHLLAVFGGWPGALAGQQLFRHKTSKLSFQVVFWLTVFVNVGVVAATAYTFLTGSG